MAGRSARAVYGMTSGTVVMTVGVASAAASHAVIGTEGTLAACAGWGSATVVALGLWMTTRGIALGLWAQVAGEGAP